MREWDPDALPPAFRPGPLDLLRFAGRLILVGLAVYGLLAALLIVRLLEWPWGRPATPAITALACRTSLRILGMPLRIAGKPMQGPGAVVANHVSWLDIFSFNSRQRIVFVAKSEVAGWPGIGILGRATGTVFVERNPRRADEQRRVLAARLAKGDKLLFFPEGTSTDGQRVLPFKSTLFAALFDPQLSPSFAVQPVTINYRAPEGEDPRFHGYWGGISLAQSMLKILSAKRAGEVEIIYHSPVRLSEFADRKALAGYCERAVRSGLRPAPAR